MINWGDVVSAQDSRKEDMRRIELAQAGKGDFPAEHVEQSVPVRPRRLGWRSAWPTLVIHRLRHLFENRLASER